MSLTLHETTDRLNATIAKVEDWLFEKHFGVAACVQFEGEYRLWFQKLDKDWRLMFDLRGEDRQPLTNASRRVRTIAIGAIPALHVALETEAELTRQGVLEAIEAVERFMEAHP